MEGKWPLESKELLALKNGEVMEMDHGNEAKTEVWRIHAKLFIFSIPLFGGEPLFESAYHIIDSQKVCDSVNSIT